jgi:hypothetical protein
LDAGGHIQNVPEEIELENDDAAIQYAKARLNTVDLHVWDGARRVGPARRRAFT